MHKDYNDEQISTAIYTVNRHAKTALDNKPLYELKRLALEKMLKTGRAKKLGLHFVKNPRFSKQQSSVLIQCADYFFHTIPKKDDFGSLPHLGDLDENYRNPQRRMNLNTAKTILKEFLGIQSSNTVRKNRITSSIRNSAPSNKKSMFTRSNFYYER